MTTTLTATPIGVHAPAFPAPGSRSQKVPDEPVASPTDSDGMTPASTHSEPTSVLPILRRHLREMGQFVEQSVNSVCADFADMAQLASQNLETRTSEQGPGNGQREVERLIDSAERMLERMQQRQRRSAQLAGHVTQSLESTRQQMHRLRSVMSEVGQIAVGTRLLSVNSRIEAAHLGENGRAFAIVADEMARLSQYTQTLVGRIESVAVDVGQQLDSIAIEMNDVSDEIVDSRSIEGVLSGLRQAHLDMEHGLKVSAERSQQLAFRISNSVMALQFQDRLNQRLDHVCRALEAVEGWMASQAVAETCQGGGRSLQGAVVPTLGEKSFATGVPTAERSAPEEILKQSYSMREEHALHDPQHNGSRFPSGGRSRAAGEWSEETEPGDVELF